VLKEFFTAREHLGRFRVAAELISTISGVVWLSLRRQGVGARLGGTQFIYIKVDPFLDVIRECIVKAASLNFHGQTFELAQVRAELSFGNTELKIWVDKKQTRLSETLNPYLVIQVTKTYSAKDNQFGEQKVQSIDVTFSSEIDSLIEALGLCQEFAIKYKLDNFVPDK
jgi:hypothetical protein